MLTTIYITPTDYLNYFGENLEDILPDDDMPSGKAERFIQETTDEVCSMLEDKCFKRIDWEYRKFSEYQKGCFKLALLHQCKYKIKNGNIANDSGYDPQTGKIIGTGDLEAIELSRQTKRYLRLCGLYNRNVKAALGGGDWMYPFRGSDD